ncbi:hypothetical protein BJY27_004317 [Streptomyces rapamycinicus]|uniref:Uncharacterized protein n=2 Tax=Streptomyces rapamycinicus TaxID=1226757 RepID=A0A3L8RP42_STRRN|nr:hypothetical protein [Streptomyces rapamycinicus]RLV81169.1 hypothetical protein D3C57_122330 [Streptomyces rapamycinicus NRRL 5491]
MMRRGGSQAPPLPRPTLMWRRCSTRTWRRCCPNPRRRAASTGAAWRDVLAQEFRGVRWVRVRGLTGAGAWVVRPLFVVGAGGGASGAAPWTVYLRRH